MIYLQLFLCFFHIGALSFGGGYAAMPLIQEQVVTKYQWLTMAQYTNLVTLSQMTPGPIAVNAATFVGIQVSGIPGAIAATAGCVMPSCVLVTILAKIYLKYRNLDVIKEVLGSLRPAVVAMIGSAGVAILVTAFWEKKSEVMRLQGLKIRSVIYFVMAFFLLRKTKISPVLAMVLCGGAEVLAQVLIRYAGIR